MKLSCPHLMWPALLAALIAAGTAYAAEAEAKAGAKPPRHFPSAPT